MTKEPCSSFAILPVRSCASPRRSARSRRRSRGSVSNHAGHTYPHFLPDGRHFLVLVQGSSEARGVYLGQLEGPDGQRLFDSDSAAVYVPGHLLFVRQTTVYAYPFDDEQLKLTGAPFEVADGALGTIDGAGPNALSAAPNGTVAFRVGLARPHSQFVWVDWSGHDIRSVGNPDNGTSPSASPDLDQVAVLRRDAAGNADVWLMETRRGVLNRFTTHPAEDVFPVLVPRRPDILFSSNRNAEWGLYRKPVTAGGESLLLRVGQEPAFVSDSSPDGHFLLYQRRSSATGWDLWTLPLHEAGASVPTVQTESDERNGQFSPDGRWIAYESNSSGPSEVFIQPFAARRQTRAGLHEGRCPGSLAGRWQGTVLHCARRNADGRPRPNRRRGRVSASWHTRSAFSRSDWHGPGRGLRSTVHRLRRWPAVSDGHVRARCEPDPYPVDLELVAGRQSRPQFGSCRRTTRGANRHPTIEPRAGRLPLSRDSRA